MPKCRLCDRSGWLLSLTDKGLCKTCAPIVGLNISQHARIIIDSINLVNNSKKLDIQLSRCDLIISRSQALLPYENRNISTITPHPSQLIDEFTNMRDNLILSSIDRDLADVIDKIPFIDSHKTIINQLNKVLLKIQEYKSQLKSPSLLDQLNRAASDKIFEIRLNKFIDDGKRAEFKGQIKKAFDFYSEALYLLNNDGNERVSGKTIEEIEKIVERLRGQLKNKEGLKP